VDKTRSRFPRGWQVCDLRFTLTGAKQVNEAASSDFFDRYDLFVKKMPGEVDRLRHQYEAFVSQNRELFQGARVLDIMSSQGFWSLAALDAGAAHVVGLEDSPQAVEAAKTAFVELSIDPKSYRFIASEIPAGLRRLEPKAVDLVLCHGFLERSDPRFVFQQLVRLQVKHVILDTRIAVGKGRIARFVLTPPNAPAGRYKNVRTIPSHELIAFFCEYFRFRLRQIDWQAMGIGDWTGIADYEKDRHRTYVLERAPDDQNKRETSNVQKKGRASKNQKKGRAPNDQSDDEEE